MNPSEDSGLEKEDLQPVPDSFPENFIISVPDPGRYDGKLVKFSFKNPDGVLCGEGTIHVTALKKAGKSLAMIMACNSYPYIATVYHFYLSQDKFDKITSTAEGFELNL